LDIVDPPSTSAYWTEASVDRRVDGGDSFGELLDALVAKRAQLTAD
jgi:hypothetical protein